MMTYLNFLTQSTVFRDNHSTLIFRGRPRLLAIQFLGGKFYLGTPDRIDVDDGMVFNDGGVFVLGYNDMRLQRDDFLEIYARTPDTISGESHKVVVLFLDNQDAIPYTEDTPRFLRW